jgi:hypothetical protein
MEPSNKRPPEGGVPVALIEPRYQARRNTLFFRRYATKPMPANPRIIMAQVEGSGTGATARFVDCGGLVPIYGCTDEINIAEGCRSDETQGLRSVTASRRKADRRRSKCRDSKGLGRNNDIWPMGELHAHVQPKDMQSPSRGSKMFIRSMLGTPCY